ncbi:MAG: secretin and TonB N-terminal domain-containing protein [Pirellulaceae bacterium]
MQPTAKGKRPTSLRLRVRYAPDGLGGRACLLASVAILWGCSLGYTQQASGVPFDDSLRFPNPAYNAAHYTDVSSALAKPGSVVFSGTPLKDVILILSKEWGVNIVAGSQTEGNVTATFRDEPLDKILDSILTANGYSYQRIGNSLVIGPATEAKTASHGSAVEVIDIPAGHEDKLDELVAALKLQMSPQGLIQPIPASGKLAISDSPERIDAVKVLLKQIAGPQPAPHLVNTTSPATPTTPAQPVTTAVELRPQFITAKDFESPLQMVIGNGTSSTIENENVIVVLGDAATHEKARQLLKQLDRPRAQVRITGYIYDVDLSEVERLGVDWNAQMMSQAVDANGIPRNLGLSQSGLLVPNAPNNAPGIATGLVNGTSSAATTAGAAATTGATTTAATGGQFLFRTLNSNIELQTMIQALDQTDGSRLLADPHVTVVDRHKASLGIVTEIPIQQLTQTQQGGSIGTTSFREAGITLDVTPRIASDGTIELEVSPEFSVLSGFQEGNPIIDTRRATTTVRVMHGQALVIGGLRSKTTVETVKGIPGLMHAKFIGKLFRTHSTNVRESELVVFIMPEIVGYCGGLEREMDALDVERRQLSRLATATDGPFSPDCGDKHCPQHCARPRIHNGMEDVGLIGDFDGVFVNPLPPPAFTEQQQNYYLPYLPAESPTVQPATPFPVSQNSQPIMQPAYVNGLAQVPHDAYEKAAVGNPSQARRIPARTASFAQ